MAKIKIITGWSMEGGSTFSLMELCDLFNERGHDCTLYGPHEWHLDKCKGDMLTNFDIEKGDTVIGHFLPMPERPPLAKKTILSCHEKEVFKLKEQEIDGYDKIRFVSKDQRSWQGVYGKVIPNCMRGVKPSQKPEGDIAGIIGTLCPMKQTHVSVQRALADGCDKVLIYGNIYNQEYYDTHIEPILSDRVIHMGMEMDKQKIYDSISCVYQSNSDDLPEAFGRVRAECIRAGIPYHGNKAATTKFELWDEDKIYDAWKELLEL
tara:strand:- start:183 stop:974 length:792 start_codon:yes stop_codon:yes gene_type:complete